MPYRNTHIYLSSCMNENPVSMIGVLLPDWIKANGLMGKGNSCHPSHNVGLVTDLYGFMLREYENDPEKRNQIIEIVRGMLNHHAADKTMHDSIEFEPMWNHIYEELCRNPQPRYSNGAGDEQRDAHVFYEMFWENVIKGMDGGLERMAEESARKTDYELLAQELDEFYRGFCGFGGMDRETLLRLFKENPELRIENESDDERMRIYDRLGMNEYIDKKLGGLRSRPVVMGSYLRNMSERTARCTEDFESVGRSKGDMLLNFFELRA